MTKRGSSLLGKSRSNLEPYHDQDEFGLYDQMLAIEHKDHYANPYVCRVADLEVLTTSFQLALCFFH